MRLVLPLLLLASVAVPAHADDVRESRYGPRSPRAQAAASAYRGPMLGWAGKVEAPAAPAPAETAARSVERPAPMAAWAGYANAPAPPQPQQPRYVPQPAMQSQAPQGALPTSLYSPPVAAAPISPVAPRVYPSSELAGGPPAVQPPQPRPAPAPAQVAAAPAYANPRAAEGLAPRTYSVGRMFGLTPDQIAAPGPPNTVLMAVDPAAVATAPADDEPQHGSADWLAQAAQEAGRDTSTSASRKKKTTAQESDF
ncbi:hypothetical protein [Caulobacter endophyticus]|uniref:Meckel syndrome type 1 protein n=1 Tax=Caulobacter endophyticus TaxID=2172652 RepID=A0A2T9K326_9CAUL|nr:hypothetical protein [Caulobacter endophyticus]PVM90334.1 hypothetical protein DDF67_10430 [Caulobacter endophyticus]